MSNPIETLLAGLPDAEATRLETGAWRIEVPWQVAPAARQALLAAGAEVQMTSRSAIDATLPADGEPLAVRLRLRGDAATSAAACAHLLLGPDGQALLADGTALATAVGTYLAAPGGQFGDLGDPSDPAHEILAVMIAGAVDPDTLAGPALAVARAATANPEIVAGARRLASEK